MLNETCRSQCKEALPILKDDYATDDVVDTPTSWTTTMLFDMATEEEAAGKRGRTILLSQHRAVGAGLQKAVVSGPGALQGED